MGWKFWKKNDPPAPMPRGRWTIRKQASNMSSNTDTYSGGSFTSGSKYIDGLKHLQAANGLKLHYDKVMKQARVAYHDSTMAKSIVDRYAMMGVGSGLFLEATPQAEILGRSPEELAEWALDVQRRFDLWARDKKNHIAEELTFYQLQHFNMRSQQRDGEYFCRIHYVDGEIKLGTFDPTQLEEGREGETQFDCGVHRNANGAVDAYRIRVADDKVTIFPRYTSNGKPLILHGFMPDYSGQVRGISQIAHILQECKLLADYQVFELIKAGLHSALNLWVKPSQDAPATNIFEGATHNAGPLAGYAEDDIPAEPDPNVTPVTYNRMDEFAAMAGGVSIMNLNAGEEVRAFDPSSPNENFSDFNKAVEDIVYSSTNQPPEIGRLSFNSNYSASQASMLLFWNVLQFWRDEQASDFNNPVYETWLDNEIARGRIRCPGWSDPFLRKAWSYAKWTGQGRVHIDPVKHTTGEKQKVELGATTLERIAREMNGSNSALNRAKLKKELADMPAVPWQGGGQEVDEGDNE
jgi:lambda family phage portal protein